MNAIHSKSVINEKDESNEIEQFNLAAQMGTGSPGAISLTDQLVNGFTSKDVLMQELEKVYKIADKFDQKMRVVLVLDSNVGQNGMNQALEFNKFIPIDSLILTKMDGTARGGIAVSLVNKLKLPIDFIGVGEQIDDLVPFDLDIYLEGLIKNE